MRTNDILKNPFDTINKSQSQPHRMNKPLTLSRGMFFLSATAFLNQITSDCSRII